MPRQPRSVELSEKFEAAEQAFDGLEEAQAAIASGRRKDDETRQEVARKFVKYYFLLMTVIIIGVPAYNAGMFAILRTNELEIPFKDAILTYSAVVGPTVGLVVAYYFKSKQE